MPTYINPAMQSQDLGGLNAVYQNMAAQQQFQNQAAMQGQQMTQQAGQIGKQGGGMNPMAMAAALRKDKKPTDPYAANNGDPYANAQTASKLYGAENVYGYGGQGQIPSGMGTDVYSPVSNMPAVGAYGQLIPVE
jgi:hypothetical protein